MTAAIAAAAGQTGRTRDRRRGFALLRMFGSIWVEVGQQVQSDLRWHRTFVTPVPLRPTDPITQRDGRDAGGEEAAAAEAPVEEGRLLIDVDRDHGV